MSNQGKKSAPSPTTIVNSNPAQKPAPKPTPKPTQKPTQKPAPTATAKVTTKPSKKPITNSTLTPATKSTAKPSPKPTPKSSPKPPKSWSMRPSYHDSVSDLLKEHNLFFKFHTEDDDVKCEESYDTNIMGRFTCHNRRCPTSAWTSKKIAVTIRMYTRAGYNARVYHQRCKSCNRLSKPKLDDSYAERVAYRLAKWCGVQVEAPAYSGRSKAPHEGDLCEGCKHGHCTG